MELRVFADYEALSRAAAAFFERVVRQLLQKKTPIAVALAGGQTPRRTYEHLRQLDLPWEHLHFFWGDERCVPPDDPRSNYRMACETFLSHIPIPSENLHPIPCLDTPEEAAELYEEELRSFCGPDPCLDFVWLGLGKDGHTASLFPHTPALAEKKRWVLGVHPKGTIPRVTLTYPVLNCARWVVFLVSGREKAPVLAMILKGRPFPQSCPAAGIRPLSGNLLWFVDREAAALLQEPAS